jgi:hypothetical protein
MSMGHIPQTVSIHLNLLHWDDVLLVSGGGGISGGPPTVTPYLWILFFKADGSTLQLTDAFKFAGSPVTVPTLGSHGNLGVKSVQIGQPISIPAAIGQWNAVSIQPIPVAPVFQGTVGHDLPGLFGVVALVMIQGSVPEDAAEKGHAAFNQAVAGALADTISHMERKPDTDAIATEVQKPACG